MTKNDDYIEATAYLLVLGKTLLTHGKLDAALKRFKDCIRVCEDALQISPSREIESRRATAYSYVSGLLDKLGMVDEALEPCETALELVDQLLKEEPDSLYFLKGAASTRVGRAMLVAKQNRYEDAAEAFKYALEAYSRLRELEPEYPHWPKCVEFCENQVAYNLELLGILDESLDWSIRATRTREEICGEDPANLLPRRDLAISYLRTASLLNSRERFEEALDLVGKSQSILGPLSSQNPEDLGLLTDVGMAHYLLATILAASGRNEEAMVEFMKNLAVDEIVVERSKGAATARRGLAVSCTRIGLLHLERGELGLARGLLLRSQEVFSGLDSDSLACLDLALCLACLAELKDAEGDTEAAAKYDGAAAILDWSREPPRGSFQRDIFPVLHKRLRGLCEREPSDESLAALSRCRRAEEGLGLSTTTLDSFILRPSKSSAQQQ